MQVIYKIYYIIQVAVVRGKVFFSKNDISYLKNIIHTKIACFQHTHSDIYKAHFLNIHLRTNPINEYNCSRLCAEVFRNTVKLLKRYAV